jgi:hypothetical protein
VARTNPVEVSRKLCDEADALRDASKLTVASLKEAVARSQVTQARIGKRRQSKTTCGLSESQA